MPGTKKNERREPCWRCKCHSAGYLNEHATVVSRSVENVEPWSPSSGVVTHDQQDISADACFFCGPDAAIGRVLSASSTVSRSNPPVSAGLVLAIPLGLFFLIVAGFAVWGHFTFPNEPTGWISGGIPGVLLGILVMIISAIVISRKSLRRCTYVGELGIASYEYLGIRKMPVETLVLFNSCHDVLISKVDTEVNHVYVATAYKYSWRDQSGQEMHSITGEYRSRNNPPPSGHQYSFADAAERQWNVVALRRMKQQFERDGKISFSVDKSGSFTIGPGYLDVIVSGNTNHLTPKDVKSIGITEGRFLIQTHEARWFRSRGKHEFLCATIGNLSLFLKLLGKIGGFTNVANR